MSYVILIGICTEPTLDYDQHTANSKIFVLLFPNFLFFQKDFAGKKFTSHWYKAFKATPIPFFFSPTDLTDPTDPTDLLDPSDLLSVSRPCKVRVKSVWVVDASPRQAFLCGSWLKPFLSADSADGRRFPGLGIAMTSRGFLCFNSHFL